MDRSLDQRSIDTIRFLAVDMVQRAGAGHPGLPMGAAPMAYTLFDRFLRFDPLDPAWPNRDRFVLSAGHGSALLYALLHLTGYDLPMSELRRFRRHGSRTPGHPESRLTPGVEATTGPLGQGIGNAVGMAIAETMMAATYNRQGHEIVGHYTYCLVSDGDLMEGVSSEAGSLAGHLRLGKLIVLYDDNRVSIEGSTELTFTEDRVARFDAFGWHTSTVEDGNDVASIETAIRAAREVGERPSLIAVRTHIGYGSPNKQDSAEAHGEPLGAEEVRLAKERLGWPTEPDFFIPDDVSAHMRRAVDAGARRRLEWQGRMDAYAEAYPHEAAELGRRLAGELPEGWDARVPAFAPEGGPIATREAGGRVMRAIAMELSELVGGAGDLAPSTKTLIGGGDYQAGHRTGRNLRFGVREHAMGTIVNGMAYHGGLLPYGATFLIFSDYMRPSLRLAALGGLHVIHVFTHDSIGLGEDGPTHEPVEHLLGLRAIPGVLLLRPGDANETAAAWRIAVEQRRPVLLALTRQKIPVLDPDVATTDAVRRGAYVYWEPDGAPDVTLVASGSELHLALDAVEPLAEEGVSPRVVSMPCWRLFAEQPGDYRTATIPPDVPTVSIEAGVTLGWDAYLGPKTTALGVDRYGSSGKGAEVMAAYGFTVESVVEHTLALLREGGKVGVTTLEPG